ncbi:MAG: VOC family protein [Akkermansiaceae bacterium]|nr:VOC family protein [Akkermansiaceae bacterium]
MKATYVHTNLVAEDWRRLARFYQEVFGCEPVPPARDYRGGELEAATGVKGAALQGMHLRLPGLGPDGPTLEIFQYEGPEQRERPAINRPGFAHIAFAVEDVAAARDEVIAAGGSDYGRLTVFETGDGRRVSMVYLADPEGNIIELQAWD